MAYEDFLRQYTLGQGNTSIPGLQAPVTLQPAPGTSQPAWVQQAIAQQQAQTNQAVQQQQLRDQQAAAQAEANAKAAEEKAKSEKRGGGMFAPLIRAAHGVADFPSTVLHAAQNIAQNPFSMGAWGSGILSTASYAVPILNIPLDYSKEITGQLIKSMAQGYPTPFIAQVMLTNPMARLVWAPYIVSGRLLLPDRIRNGINRAFDSGVGYKQFHGGSGVWEYAQSSIDSWPDAIRYPTRAAIDIIFDPLTWIGVGAAGDAAKLTKLEQITARMSPEAKLAARAEMGLTGTANRTPLMRANDALNAINRPADKALSGVAWGIGKAAKAIPGVDSIFTQSERKLQEIAARRTGWHLARFSRDQEQYADALFNLPGFTEEAPKVTDSGQVVHTLTNVADNKKITVVEEVDGNVRVITPGNPEGQLFPDAQTAAQQVYQSARSLQTTPVGNVMQEAPLEPLSTRELRSHPNRFDRNPSPRLSFRDMPGGGFEVDIPGRGSRIAMPNADGTWDVTDDVANPLGNFKSDKEAYTFAANDLHNQAYAYTTLSGGQEVGPSFGAKPGGARPQDLVAGMDQSDPRVAQFNQQTDLNLRNLRNIIQREDDNTRRALEQSGTLRRDLPVDEAQGNRPRTNDSVAKSMAEAIGTMHGHRNYRNIFGEPSQAFPRMWQGDEAKLIRQFEAKSRQVRGLTIKDTVNTREAIYQAMFTDNAADAETIINFFTRHRYMVNPADAEHLLINPGSEVAQEIIRRAKRTKGAPFGKILRENREELIRSRQRPELDMPVRPLDANAPKVVPTEIVREPIPYEPVQGPSVPRDAAYYRDIQPTVVESRLDLALDQKGVFGDRTFSEQPRWYRATDADGNPTNTFARVVPMRGTKGKTSRPRWAAQVFEGEDAANATLTVKTVNAPEGALPKDRTWQPSSSGEIPVPRAALQENAVSPIVVPKGAAQMRKRAIEAYNRGTINDELLSVNDRLDQISRERRNLIGSKNLSARNRLDAEAISLKGYRERLEAAAKGHEAEGTLGFRPGDFQRSRTIPAHQVGEVDPTLAALPPTTSPMQNVDAFGRSEQDMVYPQANQQFRRPTGEVVDQPSTGDRPIFTLGDKPVPGMTRLYRAELRPELRKELPPDSYIRQSQEASGHADAAGRWFAQDPEEVQWYIDHEFPGDLRDQARIVHVDVPTADLEKYRVSNLTDAGTEGPNRPVRYSLRADKEFFLPRELADTKVESSLPDRVEGEPIKTMLGQPSPLKSTLGEVPPEPAATGVQERAAPLYQALQDAGDDPVKRQQATDDFVREITKADPVKADQQLSGYGSYVVRGEEGMPEVSIHVGDDNAVTITALDPDDPMVKNLVARAGTDVPVTVKRGLPDQVLSPAGLDTAATMPNSDRITDPLARSLALGKLSQDGFNDLSQTIEVPLNPSGKGKKITVRIGDYYMMQRGITGSQEEALKATMDMVRKNKVTGGVRLPRVIRAWDSWISHQRDVLMFNWATGAPAGVLDHLGDTFRMASMGRLKEAAKVNQFFGKDLEGKRHFLPQAYRAAYGEAKGDLSSMMLNTDDGRYLSKLGIEEPPTANLGIGREETHRKGESQIARSLIRKGVSEKTAKGIQRAGATVLMDGSEFMMHMRSAGDLGRRFTTYVGSIRRQMPQARNDFFDLAETRVARDKAFDMGTFEQSLGDVFSPDDVRIRAQEAGADVGMSERLARDWQESLTKVEYAAEEDLNKVLFSYEATQADEVLKRIFLFHYWFSRATVNYSRTIVANPYLYVNYMRAMDGLERASEGQPGAVKGLIKALSGPGGFMIMMDPIKFMTTAVSLRDQAFQDGDGNAFDNFLAQSGLFFNPTLNAAATFLGLTKNDNPDPFTTFQMRRIFGGAANLVNAERGGGMLGAPYQEAMNQAAEEGSRFFANHGMPFADVQAAKDPKANDRTLIRNEILDLVQKDLGIEIGTDFGQWTPAQIKVLEDAFDALDSGVSNPYADQAYKNWARTNAMRVGMTMTLPVGTTLRSETRDERLNQSRRITDPTTGESYLPVGGMGYDQEKDVTSAASGSPSDLAISDAQFDSLFPANSAGRMSTGPNGETQEQVRAQPQNARYDEYRTWKAQTVGGPDNYATFREQMEKVSPAYAAYMDELRSQPFYQENPDALDNAAVSFAAFLVLNGEKVQQFDPNRGDTFDISKVNPSTFSMGPGAATQNYTAPTSMEDLQSMIIGQLMSYQQDQQAFQQAASRYFGHPIQIDAISPYAQRFIRNELAKFGIRIPELGTQASSYQAWARTQPMGADTSIQAYLRSFGMNTPLTPYPSQATILAS